MSQTPDQPREHDQTGVRESNPNSTGPQRLTGDMGISSERTGPEGEAPVDTGVQGTGTHGSAAHSTDGLSNTSREAPEDATDETGKQGDPLQQGAHVAELREGRHAQRRSADDDNGEFSTGVDRTVGEHNPAEVPAHPFDRSKSPGHSHG
jgi:hypothetical protein